MGVLYEITGKKRIYIYIYIYIYKGRSHKTTESAFFFEKVSYDCYRQ